MTDTLRADLAQCAAEAKAMALNPSASHTDVIAHLNNTLWPMLENVVNEIVEIDDSVSAMYENAEDILQPDTAAEIKALIAGAQILVAELKNRVGNDARLLAAIKEWNGKAVEMQSTIDEITTPDTTDEEDDDDGDDDGDDDDGDDARSTAEEADADQART